MLKVNEIFKSIQGEGNFTGWPAIFIRFSGCNLVCNWCDTTHKAYTRMEADELVKAVKSIAEDKRYLVVLTGGEPLIQDLKELYDLCIKLKSARFTIHLETNGTIAALDVIQCVNCVTCSPKQDLSDLKIPRVWVDCWKIIFPCNFDLLPYKIMASNLSGRFYLQPRWVVEKEGSENFLEATVKRVLEWGLPWKLSLQTQKYIKVP